MTWSDWFASEYYDASSGITESTQLYYGDEADSCVYSTEIINPDRPNDSCKSGGCTLCGGIIG